MKRTTKILSMALLSVFLLAGVALALPIATPDYTWTYYNPIPGTEDLVTPTPDLSNPGAIVYMEESAGATYNYRYTYQVENVNFNPEGALLPTYIGYFLVPVATPFASGVNDDGYGFVSLGTLIVGTDTVLEASMFLSFFPGGDLVSNSFWIESNYLLAPETALIADGSTASLLVLSNTGALGGGGSTDPVPEPATLLLFGIGMLGAEAIRRTKNSRA
jgi:hypothetical protein